jgi:hypothetical protein
MGRVTKEVEAYLLDKFASELRKSLGTNSVALINCVLTKDEVFVVTRAIDKRCGQLSTEIVSDKAGGEGPE